SAYGEEGGPSSYGNELGRDELGRGCGPFRAARSQLEKSRIDPNSPRLSDGQRPPAPKQIVASMNRRRSAGAPIVSCWRHGGPAPPSPPEKPPRPPPPRPPRPRLPKV